MKIVAEHLVMLLPKSEDMFMRTTTKVIEVANDNLMKTNLYFVVSSRSHTPITHTEFREYEKNISEAVK